MLGGFDPLLRLLLKGMQHVDPTRQADGVDCPERVAIVVLDQLEDACAFEALQRFRLRRFQAVLDSIKRMAQVTLNSARERLELLLARLDPDERLRRFSLRLRC
jgi:hypothetical protein